MPEMADHDGRDTQHCPHRRSASNLLSACWLRQSDAAIGSQLEAAKTATDA